MNSGFGSSNNLFVTVAAIAAIVLSVIAIYLGISARHLEVQMNNLAADVNQRVADVTQQTEAMGNQLRALASQVDGKFIALGGQVQALASRIVQQQKPSTPSGEAKTQGSSVSVAGTYKIKAGDTLEKIAKANKTSVDAIMKANPGIDPRRLKVNQTIKLHGASTPPLASSPAPEPMGEPVE